MPILDPTRAGPSTSPCVFWSGKLGLEWEKDSCNKGIKDTMVIIIQTKIPPSRHEEILQSYTLLAGDCHYMLNCDSIVIILLPDNDMGHIAHNQS